MKRRESVIKKRPRQPTDRDQIERQKEAEMSSRRIPDKSFLINGWSPCPQDILFQ